MLLFVLSAFGRKAELALADLSGAFTPGGFVRRPFLAPGTSPRRFRRLASHDAALWLDFPHHRRQAKALDLGFHLGRVLVAERRLGEIRCTTEPTDVPPYHHRNRPR